MAKKRPDPICNRPRVSMYLDDTGHCYCAEHAPEEAQGAIITAHTGAWHPWSIVNFWDEGYSQLTCEECVSAGVQAALNQDLDDIKRDIAKHGVAY